MAMAARVSHEMSLSSKLVLGAIWPVILPTFNQMAADTDHIELTL